MRGELGQHVDKVSIACTIRHIKPARLPLAAITLLGILGAIAAVAGGASLARGALRVCFWGRLAMGLTALIGKVFGIST